MTTQGGAQLGDAARRATSPPSGPSSEPRLPERQRLRRDLSARWLGGVCAGIARRYGVDVWLVRLAFMVAAAAGGLGVVLYALAWLVIPAGDVPSGARRRLPTGRAAVEVALGTGLLLLSVLLTFRALGLWFSDAIVWPLVLVASGGALIWRGSLGDSRSEARPRETAAARTPTAAGGPAPATAPPAVPREAVRSASGRRSRSSAGRFATSSRRPPTGDPRPPPYRAWALGLHWSSPPPLPSFRQPAPSAPRAT